MPDSRWVIIPLWLSGSWRSFLYSSSVYSCHLFLISSASVRSIPFVFYWAHLCMKCSLSVSNFLDNVSSLSHFIVFLYFFALITEEGFLLSLCSSLELYIQMRISFLFSFAFRFSSQLFVRPPQTTISPFLHFFSLGMVLIPASCTMSRTSIRSSSDTVSIRFIPWIYLSLPLYNHKGFDLGHTWMV